MIYVRFRNGITTEQPGGARQWSWGETEGGYTIVAYRLAAAPAAPAEPVNARLLEALRPFCVATLTPAGHVVGLMREDFERARAAIAAAEAQPAPAPLTEEQHKRLQAHLAQTLAQPGKPVRLDDDIVLALKSFVGMGNPIAPDPGKGYPLDALVDRFLTWPVPADVYPDGTPGQPGRTGTNLLSAPQARAMLEHVLGIGAAGEKGGDRG